MKQVPVLPLSIKQRLDEQYNKGFRHGIIIGAVITAIVGILFDFVRTLVF